MNSSLLYVPLDMGNLALKTLDAFTLNPREKFNGVTLDSWFTLWTCVGVIASFYIISQFNVHFRGPKVPLVGLHSAFQSRYAANWNFFRNAAGVLNEGHSRVYIFF
jgi:hypothetical protein